MNFINGLTLYFLRQQPKPGSDVISHVRLRVHFGAPVRQCLHVHRAITQYTLKGCLEVIGRLPFSAEREKYMYWQRLLFFRKFAKKWDWCYYRDDDGVVAVLVADRLVKKMKVSSCVLQ